MTTPRVALVSATITAVTLALATGPARLPRRPSIPNAELPAPRTPHAELRLSMRPAAADAGSVLRKLDAPIPRFTAVKRPLDRALAALADRAGVPIAINSLALRQVGLDPAAPVSVDLHDLPARVVLRCLLDDHVVNADTDRPALIELAYEVIDGGVIVSTADDLANRTVVRIYDVRDLIDPARSVAADATPAAERAGEALTSLLRLIDVTTSPPPWRDGTGSMGWRMSVMNGRLFVTASPRAHAEVAEILALLRRPASEPYPADPASARLDAPIDRLAFDKRPLAEVLATFADRTGVNVVAHWAALDVIGIKPTLPITVDVRGLPAAAALRHALNGHDDPAHINVRVADGVVIVTSALDVQRHPTRRSYEIGDLLDGAPDRAEARDALLALIHETINPASLPDGTGLGNWLCAHNTRLIVTDTAAVQDLTARLLAARRSKGASTVKP